MTFAHISYTVLAISCALKSPPRRSATIANTTNNGASDCSAFAYAHAVLAGSCALMSPTRRSVTLANILSNSASDCTALACAHAVLANPCAAELAHAPHRNPRQHHK